MTSESPIQADTQWALAWAARLSDLEFDFNELSHEASTVKTIVLFGGAPVLALLAGILGLLLGIVQLGLLIYCGFLFDPTQMGDAYYHARIATYVLVLPTVLIIIPVLLVQIPLLLSKYTTPTIRNVYLAGAVSAVTGSSIQVFAHSTSTATGFPPSHPFCHHLKHF